MMEKHRRDTLDDLLRTMPRSIAPPSTLWHAIAEEITRAQQRSKRLTVAASLAAACLCGALVWVVLHAPSSMPRGPETARVTSETFSEPRDPAYIAARADLEHSFRERLATLDPETRNTIEANLALIRKAHEDIRRAMAKQPANPVLVHLFESTWHDEFDLYQSVVQGTELMTTRS